MKEKITFIIIALLFSAYLAYSNLDYFTIPQSKTDNKCIPSDYYDCSPYKDLGYPYSRTSLII
jgi:hypothetical protein